MRYLNRKVNDTHNKLENIEIYTNTHKGRALDKVKVAFRKRRIKM